MKIDGCTFIIILVLSIVLLLIFRWCSSIDNFESFDFQSDTKFYIIGNDSKIVKKVKKNDGIVGDVAMFNCGLLKLNDDLFLTSRVSNATFGNGVWKSTPFYSRIAIKHSPIKKLKTESQKEWKLIDIKDYDSHRDFKGIEDVRPLIFKERLYLLGTTRIKDVSQMVLIDLETLTTHHLKYDESRSQKNWCPMILGDNQDELYFIYDVYPKHIILRMNDMFECSEVYNTSPQTQPNIKDLRSGVIRAGKILFEMGDELVCVANIKNQTREYYIIFYVMNKYPPFQIKRWSKVYLPNLGVYFTYLFDVCEYQNKIIFSWNLDDSTSVLSCVSKKYILDYLDLKRTPSPNQSS